MDTSFCKEALEEALLRFGTPNIQYDQGSQFTSDVLQEFSSAHGIKISMDGRALDG